MIKVVFKYYLFDPLDNSICFIRFFSSYHCSEIKFKTYAWFSSSSEVFYSIKVGVLPSRIFTLLRYFSTFLRYEILSLEHGLFYRESSFNELSLMSSRFSKFLIYTLLLARYNFYNLFKCLTFSILTIRLAFKFSSVKFDRLSMFYILVTWLCAKLRILSEFKIPNPSIFEILLLCKSKTYSFTNSLIFFILLIWFLGKSKTFNVGIPFKIFSISLIWLSKKSTYRRLGNEIKFYIFVTELCWKVNIFSFS